MRDWVAIKEKAVNGVYYMRLWDIMVFWMEEYVRMAGLNTLVPYTPR